MSIHLGTHAPVCADCGDTGEHTLWQHPMTPWRSYRLCDGCLSLRQAATPPLVEMPAAPLRREQRRPRPVRLGNQYPKYHAYPWAALSPSQRRWEDQYHEDHLDDLEFDRLATE